MDRMRFTGVSYLPRQHASAERRRLALSYLLSLLLHALLLSLTFGDQEFGLPGLGLPWQERRIEAPDLRVILRPARVAAAAPAEASATEPQPVSVRQTVAGSLTPPRLESPAPPLHATGFEAPARVEPAPESATAAVPARVPLRNEGAGDAAASPSPAVAVIAMERSDEPAFVVPPPPPLPTPVAAPAPDVSRPEAAMPPPQEEGEPAPTQAQPDVRQQGVEAAERIPSDREAQRRAEQQEAARLEAARREAEKLEARRQEAARVEAARLEAERQEAARSAAARLEAQRQEAARLEAARVETARLEAARLEAERKEAARLAAAKLEAQRQEAARQEAARLEAARLEAERQEAVRSAAAKLEAQRQDAARLEAAHLLAEQEEDARREARRRAMGRQLEEAAARRQAAANAGPRLPLSLSTARRVRLWGRADPNVELVQYAEAWARKIQLNTSVDTVREVAKRPHTDPMVTVAIRSDGSVESVSFVLSSGVAEVDEAIRRIVQGLVPYPAFPPGLARDYDVVEVRRTWHFDMAVRLY